MKASTRPVARMRPGLAAHWNSSSKNPVPSLAVHSFSKAIEIPAHLRDRPLDACHTSARLTAVLSRFGIRVLGDLHGRKVVDFAWEKNCGLKTLYELDLLARRAPFQNGKAAFSRHRCGSAHGSPSRSVGAAVGKVATAEMQGDVASFAIPESICRLSLNELPLTTRLANVVRSIGARTLGDLNERDAFELLQYKACGWSTISEIQQLIERAVSGEFDAAQIEEATASAELLSLLEQGLAKLPLRDRQFVVARIGGEIVSARSPRVDLPCPSYEEIGRRYGLTRARVHQVFTNALDSLRKIWGPRVPRLLEVIKWRCLSMICPLTPQLLGKWVDSPAAFSSPPKTRDFLNSVRLSMEAHVRLMAALDKNIPCWLKTNHRPRPIDDFVRQVNVALGIVVREAGGHITVAEAYRKLSQRTGEDYRPPTIENFLQMLPSIGGVVIEFKDPQAPTLRLSERNGDNLRVQIQTDQPSAPEKTSPEAIPLFGVKSVFRERATIGRC